MSFEQMGQKIGSLVDEKQKAYGNSVDSSFQVMKIYMARYKNADGTYTIPEELLQHIMLMVRIMDKQSRIFSNPKGDLMGESPYQDILGYGMLGTKMQTGGKE